MITQIISRILWIASLMIAVSVVVFAIVHLAGDPTDGFVEPAASPEVRTAIRQRLGLDEPLPRQYLHFASHAVTGDFGESWRARKPALTLVLDRLPATIALAAFALTLAILVGSAAGVLNAQLRHRTAHWAGTSLVSVGQAIPSFWLGATLVLLFAVRLNWLPSSGRSGFSSLILPAVTLAVQPAAMLARIIETQIREAMRSDFVRTARGKGLDEQSILIGHALRSSVGPVLAYLGIQTGFLIGGAVIVEGVFAYPGVGLLALNAVQDRDLPVIQSFVIVLALIITVITMSIDLLARLSDPRISEAASR
jgi:peptide/nickel transport system permease protein